MHFLLVRLAQQALQAQQHALHVIDSAPLVLQDIQAYATRKVDIRMVDGCLEEDGWWRIRIVRWEIEGELEGKVGIWSVVRAGDRCRPQQEVFRVVGEGRDAWSGGHHELHELCLEATSKDQSLLWWNREHKSHRLVTL